eukprot:s2395_g10.t1
MTVDCGEDAYAASLWGGSIGGIVVGILVIVLMSLPLCCGVLKQYGKAGKISGADSRGGTVLGAIGIVLGVLALIIPLFGALGSCVPFVDAACNDACTPCTDEEKKVSCHLSCGDLLKEIWGEGILGMGMANLRLGGQSVPIVFVT